MKMKVDYQTRQLASPVVRSDEGKMHLVGIIPYESVSEDLGGFKEKIARGAFTKTLQERDVVCLRNHDTTQVMGRMSAGTFSITDTEDGLTFDCVLPDTQSARELYASVERGDAPGVSFGFFVVKDERHTGIDGTVLRTLIEVSLLEISVGVTFPAYPDSGSWAQQRDLLSVHGIDIQSVCDAVTGDNYSDEKIENIRSTIRALEALLPTQPEETMTDGSETESTVEEKPDDKSTLNCYMARQRDIDLLTIEGRRN